MPPAWYRYNDKNQLVEAADGGGTVYNSFNAEGLRVSKTVDGVTTYYCYEYSQVIKEAGDGDTEAYHVYGHNLISRELDGEKVYYLYNGHGDVTALLTENGTVAASYYYDAFGVAMETSGSFDNPYRYAGYVYDEETELYNLNARFYAPGLARFLQEDTYLGDKSDPLSLNLYTYCRNNPLIYYDPTGHVVSESDKKNLNAAQRAAIQKATNDYDKAKARGDRAGMAAAHAAAEKIRSGAGYSGGVDGSKYTPSGVPVRSTNRSQGNKVEWDNKNRSIIITAPNHEPITLKEGKDFYVAADNIAYYYNNPNNMVTKSIADASSGFKRNGNGGLSTITFSTSTGISTLMEGKDYYIGNDGRAYFYNNINTFVKANRAINKPMDAPVSSIASPWNLQTAPKYLGADGAWHFVDPSFGILPPGPLEEVILNRDSTLANSKNNNLGKPNSSGFVLLPEGTGYNLRGCDNPDLTLHHWGTPETIEYIQKLGQAWHDSGYEELYNALAIGDISLEHGGKMPDHTSHRSGDDIDVSLIRKDGGYGTHINNTDHYSREAARRMIETMLEVGGSDVESIWFNDKVLINEFEKVTFMVNHDNHIHINLK